MWYLIRFFQRLFVITTYGNEVFVHLLPTFVCYAQSRLQCWIKMDLIWREGLCAVFFFCFFIPSLHQPTTASSRAKNKEKSVKNINSFWRAHGYNYNNNNIQNANRNKKEKFSVDLFFRYMNLFVLNWEWKKNKSLNGVNVRSSTTVISFVHKVGKIKQKMCGLHLKSRTKKNIFLLYKLFNLIRKFCIYLSVVQLKPEL